MLTKKKAPLLSFLLHRKQVMIDTLAALERERQIKRHLIAAAEEVLHAWEYGDLGAAIHDLAEAVAQAEGVA